MTDTGFPPPLRALPGGRLASPSTAAAESRLRDLGVDPMPWSNGPGDRYRAHEHGFTKLLVCAEGSITFLVGDDETPVELSAGDGFELPPGTRHAAIAATCIHNALRS